MRQNIEAVGLELTQALRTYAEQKFSTLQKFLTRLEKDGELGAHIEIQRTTKHHRKGDVYQVNVEIRLPKKILRVQEKADDMRKAIDKAKDILRFEIEKYRTKFMKPARAPRK